MGGGILSDFRFPTYSLVYFAQFVNLLSLDGMVCFPESSFGTTGVLTLTFLLVLKLDFFMDIGLVTFTSIESFNLAYFPQDVCLLRKVCGGLGFRCSLPSVAKSTLTLH